MGELRVLDDLRVDHGLAKEMVFQEEVESMARSGEVIRLAEATYRNVLRQHTWNHEALDTVNSNIVDQHSQMREELQSRHQDVVDDVNQYSFCLTNHLLKEIIEKALRGRVAPLSSQCMELLRSDSNFPSGIRKLRDGTSSLHSLVVWDDDSVVGMLRSAVDMMKGSREDEAAIVEMQRNIDATAMKLLKQDERILDVEEKMLAKDNVILSELKTIKESLGPNQAESAGKNIFGLKKEMGAQEGGGAAEVNKKLEEMKVKFDKLEGVEDKLAEMETKLDKLEGVGKKLTDMKTKQDKLEEMMAKLLWSAGHH